MQDALDDVREASNAYFRSLNRYREVFSYRITAEQEQVFTSADHVISLFSKCDMRSVGYAPDDHLHSELHKGLNIIRTSTTELDKSIRGSGIKPAEAEESVVRNITSLCNSVVELLLRWPITKGKSVGQCDICITHFMKNRKMAGRCDMQLGDITHHNVLQLKRLNQAVFPFTCNDKFYTEVVTAGNLAKLAYFNDVVVGAVCCRVGSYEGQKSLYIMTLGTLAPYRQLGVGKLLLEHVFDLCKRDASLHNVFLHVQVNNEHALSFYKKYDFEQVKIVENYFNGIESGNAYILVKKTKISWMAISRNVLY